MDARPRVPVPALSSTALLAVAYGGIAFQAVHALEHVLQLGHWVADPGAPPWLSGWAAVGRDVLAAAADGNAANGTELLHLGGNLVFLTGLAAAVVVVRRWDVPRSRTVWLRWALWLQAAHVGEHVVLTATAFLLGAAQGISTGFGLLAPGTVLATAVRVALHFALNTVATVLAVGGLPKLLGSRPAHARERQPSGAAAQEEHLTADRPVTRREERAQRGAVAG